MKIFKILLVIAIAFGMMACNNEEVPQVNDGPEATISVKVFPSSDGPSFKSVGDLSTPGQTTDGLAAESAVNTLEVWIFENGNLKAHKEQEGNEVTQIPTVAGLMKIVVVANANIGTKPTLTELLNVVKELPARNVIETEGAGLIMTAEPFELTLKPGNNYYGYENGYGEAPKTPTYHSIDTPLQITRVNARVALVSAVLDYENVPENQKLVFDALKDVQVAMFNVPNETKLFGAPLATNTAFQYGVQWPSPDLSYVGANESPAAPNALLDEGTLTLPATLHNLIENTSAPYFYVNENTSDVEGDKETKPSEKMLIVLRAKVYKGNDVVKNLDKLYTDVDGYTYYPVWVNVAKPGYSYAEGYVADGKVLRNTQYNISLTIKGLGRPTIDEVEDAWLDVNVSVAPWIVVNQNVEW